MSKRLYVYEVVTTSKQNGARDSVYFNSEKAAKKWKECRERDGLNTAVICQWRVFTIKDI